MNKNKMKKNNNMGYSMSPMLEVDETTPENSFQMVNRFGRCNVQSTANTDNSYPEIAQGLSKKVAESVDDERKRWREQNDKESGGKYKH